MKLKEYVELHLKVLKEAVKSSELIYQYAKIDDVKRLDLESENRNRIVNTLEYVQGNIEKIIDRLTPEEADKKVIDLLNNWQTEMGGSISKISEIDKKVLELLAESKNETMKEIATVYKNKNSIGGYNLTNTK